MLKFALPNFVAFSNVYGISFPLLYHKLQTEPEEGTVRTHNVMQMKRSLCLTDARNCRWLQT